MTIGFPGLLASAVWAAATRNLTAVSTPWTSASTRTGSLGAGAVLNVRSPTSAPEVITLFCLDNANAVVVGLYDGTTFSAAAAGAASPAMLTGGPAWNNSSIGMVIKNNGASASAYGYVAELLT